MRKPHCLPLGSSQSGGDEDTETASWDAVPGDGPAGDQALGEEGGLLYPSESGQT